MAIIKTNLTHGTTGNLPAVNGSAVTALNASNVSSGTLNTSRYVQGGITEADTWRITTNFQGDVNPITNNWERDDGDDPINLGTGMTQSSGVFTFPNTGVWQVTFYHNFSGASDNEYIESIIAYTTNNSSYGGAAKAWGTAPGNGDYNMVTTSAIFDITNVSEDKVRFGTSSQDGNAHTQCHTGENLTYVTFIRLGDT